MGKEYSVVLIKPDGVRRGLIGEVISRFEKIGLKIIAAKFIHVDKKFASQHYGYDEEWYQKTAEILSQNIGNPAQIEQGLPRIGCAISRSCSGDGC